jgi:hypothetical protein
MTDSFRRVLLLTAILAVAPAVALAQAMPRPDTAAASRALTQEVLGIFETVCLAATLSGESVPVVVDRVLGSRAAAVPAGQLLATGRLRETGGWIVNGQFGRYRLNTVELAGQCGLFAEGVDHDAFLDGTTRILGTVGSLASGWAAAGAPQRESGVRPFGTLTYLRANFIGNTTPPRMLTVTGSAASRTDGRPNTGFLTSALRDPSG